MWQIGESLADAFYFEGAQVQPVGIALIGCLLS